MPDQTKEDVLAHLKELDVYLGGSRKMLKGRYNYLIKDDTDYDFQVGIHATKDMFWTYEYDDPRIDILLANGEWEYKDRNDDYDLDNLFYCLYKHFLYPEITIVVRKNLPLYIKVMDSVSFNYWYKYLWKSNPGGKFDLEKAVDWFNNSYEMMDHKFEEDMW